MNPLIFVLLISFSTNKLTTAEEDLCAPFKDVDYKLFGSKTTYKDAYDYILNHYDAEKSDNTSFGRTTLEREHASLIGQGCKPMMLFFVGRHAARFPDAHKIELYNKDVSKIRDQMKARLARKCLENKKFESFLNWQPKMVPRMDNLITDSGGNQERDLAKRLKYIYPEFFNSSKTDIQFGVTKKIRTAQTGVQFLREVDNFEKLTNCSLRSLPTNDIFSPSFSADKIMDNACYKSIMQTRGLSMLQFHDECKQIQSSRVKQEDDDEDKEPSDPLVELISRPEVVKKIIERVSRSLGLPEVALKNDTANSATGMINERSLYSLYNMCRFERAYQSNSTWCKLFNKSDLLALEFINDAKIYLEDVYGSNAKPKQSCAILSKLLEALDEGSFRADRTSSNKPSRSYFYFTHETALKKLFAGLALFQDFHSTFSSERIKKFIEDTDIVTEEKLFMSNQWRTSIVGPFSANIAFVLYGDCRDQTTKLLTLVNERPVRLVAACSGEIECDTKHFVNFYQDLRDCNLKEICSGKAGDNRQQQHH